MLKSPKLKRSRRGFNKGKYIGQTKAVIVNYSIRCGNEYWIGQSADTSGSMTLYAVRCTDSVGPMSDLRGRLLVIRYVGMSDGTNRAPFPTWEMVNK